MRMQLYKMELYKIFHRKIFWSLNEKVNSTF